MRKSGKQNLETADDVLASVTAAVEAETPESDDEDCDNDKDVAIPSAADAAKMMNDYRFFLSKNIDQAAADRLTGALLRIEKEVSSLLSKKRLATVKQRTIDSFFLPKAQ